MNHTVTFETKCYENDWQFLLRKGYLQRMVENCAYPFTEKVLFINNVDNLARVKKAADKLVAKNILDKYYVVEEYADQALQALDINKDSFKGGYYYSIAELVSIYLCKSEFLLHFSSDAMLEKKDMNWIDTAIGTMNQQPNILVANPTWDFDFKMAKDESFAEDENWYYSYGFSDQCYLIRTIDFKQPIYNEYHPFSDRYPAYGGELFEKRVDSYMRNKERWRITSKTIAYQHENFPKDKKERFIRLYLKRS